MKLRSKFRASDIPDKCVICAKGLKPHERAEAFCDECLRKAQQQPFPKSDRSA